MITKRQVEEALDQVLLPDVRLSVMQLNLLRRVEIRDTRMRVTLSDAAISADVRDWLTATVPARLRSIDGVTEITADFRQSSPRRLNRIEKVVAVMSGKGGVGKSLVTGLLTLAMARQGKQVGILDADVTGPSIPRMFNIKNRPAGSETGLLPLLSRTGIRIMSMNLLVPKEDDAVTWCGAVIARSISRFWKDVLWGKLDFLMLDMPPGTSDVPLTVMQTMPLSGIVIVLTPQDLTAMVVRKSVKMAKQMNVPVLGVVENMSFFLLPGTGKKIELFGRSKGAPVLGRIPIDPELARLCDEGDIESYDSAVFRDFQKAVMAVLSPGQAISEGR